MDNGIVTAKIRINTAQLTNLTYNGVQLTDGYYASANGCFYWQGRSGSLIDTLVIVKNPSTNGGDIAEISLENPNSVSGGGADAHRHFTMKRGSPGIYVTQIFTRDASMAAAGLNIPSLTGKLTGSTVLNWLASDGNDPRSVRMPVDTVNYATGISDSPKEVSQMLDGVLAGQFDCKYNYSGDLGQLSVTGWCGTSGTAGIWMIHPSDEYFTNGPMHREILSQMKIVQATFSGVHFGFNPDLSCAAGEALTKVNGPLFIYLNKATGANPQDTMVADAKAQALAERSAWPYTWMTDSSYIQASGRGTVTGKIIINDTQNPNASGADLWVGVGQQPTLPTTPATDFQLWGKNYQFWVKTDGAGNFSIPNVIAGSNYTLFAFGPGANGQFQSQALTGTATPVRIDYPASQFAVTVTGGQTAALGNLTWTPARVGPTVFEIGVPDRNTQEFRHGDDYWHGELASASAPGQLWAPFQFFPYEWPSGLKYTAGQSHWATDWDYAQPTVYNQTSGTYGGNTWAVTFNLSSAPTAGISALLYLGLASANSSPVIVSINGTNLASTSGVTATPAAISSNPAQGFSPAYDDSSVVFRMASHGIFCDERITFPASLLKAGANTITLNMRNGGYFANAIQYDYVRLEMPGYVPSAPASVTALPGNAAVQLRWPAAPGATSYKVLRSTTSGSAFAVIASGATGPVSGSTPDTVSYFDSTATNGTPYYYVIQSVNSVNSSANSAQTTATPSAATPGAPAAPTGLAATPGDRQVGLNWTASANAAYYIVKRSLTNGGPYTVISDTTTTNSYTDLGRSNGMTYYYVVDAANASGLSADSAQATTSPLPMTITAAPTNLTVTNSAGLPSLAWSVVPNATGYNVQRATSAAGTYTILTSTAAATSYVDSSAAGNTTYYYKVGGANLSGTASFTSPVSILTPPSPPTTVTATAGSAKVTVSWTASVGATSYVVRRATTSGGGYTTVASAAAGLSYVDSPLTNGVTYYYVVAATNAGGTGVNSAEVNAIPVGATTLVWTGSTNSTWDTTTANWLNGAAASAYANGNYVTFDDTAANNTVTISGTLTPGAVFFNNSTKNYTLTAADLSGTTTLTKQGTGTLTISGIDTFTGGTIISAGTIAIGGTISNVQNGLGTGPITLQGGTLALNGFGNSSTSTYGVLSNAINVPSGTTGLLQFPRRGGQSGAVAGNGTLTVQVNYVRDDISGNWSAFTGQINIIHTSPGTTVDNFRLNNNAGFGTAAMNLGPYVQVHTLLNATNTFTIGELSSTDSTSKLTGVAPDSGTPGGVTATYVVGGRNTNATYAGTITNGNGTSLTAITKEGTGAWTLSGTCTYTGPTLITGGTLILTGSMSGTSSLGVGVDGTMNISGPVSVSGTITNQGVIRLGASGSITSTGTFTNNGLLDLINGPQSLPPHFVNNGTVLDSSSARVSSATATDTSFTVSLSGYAGHTYQLQRTASLTAPNWQNVAGASQSISNDEGGAVALTLTDPVLNASASFYRVVVTTP